MWNDKEESMADEPTIMKQLSALKVICKESQDREEFQSQNEKFKLSYKKGAVFMGVAGGKLAEGIDFSDDMARMVILVGIPFGNKSAPRLIAKEKYLDERCKKSDSTGVNNFNFTMLNRLRQSSLSEAEN